MQAVRQSVERAAALNVPILILGESGTGKEVLARFIHNRSPWRNGPFVKVNCPAIPGTLLESELFGFEKGAFTGATAAKPGRIEMAQGGTLFLDEIAELDASLQAKLLHVLQDGHFTRIGDHEEKRMDARVICATNRILKQEIENGGFRSDLFYRINVISVTLPVAARSPRRYSLPGRISASDVQPPLPARGSASSPKRRFTPCSSGIGRATCANSKIASRATWFWVRKRRFTPSAPKGSPSASPTNGRPTGNIPLKRIAQQVTRRMEHDVILKVLQENHWNRRKAAQVLKISYRALLYKVRQAGLPAKRPRRKAEPELSGIFASRRLIFSLTIQPRRTVSARRLQNPQSSNHVRPSIW